MANAVQEKASDHLVHPTMGVLLPTEVLVKVAGRTIHAPGVPTNNEKGIKYVAAKDAKLASDNFEAALAAIVVEYDGQVIVGGPVLKTEARAANPAKGIRARKGGELYRTFSLGTIILGEGNADDKSEDTTMAYQLRVTGKGKVRGGTKPVVNLRVEAWRQGGSEPIDIGSVDGDEEFAV